MPNPLQKPTFHTREDGMSTDVMDKAKAEAISEPLIVLTGDPSVGKGVTGDTLVLGADGLHYLEIHWGVAVGEVRAGLGVPTAEFRKRYKRAREMGSRFSNVAPGYVLGIRSNGCRAKRSGKNESCLLRRTPKHNSGANGTRL